MNRLPPRMRAASRAMPGFGQTASIMTLGRIQVASISYAFLAMLSNTEPPAQPPEPNVVCNDDVRISYTGQLANAGTFTEAEFANGWRWCKMGSV